MSEDAEVTVPGPKHTDPVKAEIYQIRGEIVSIGGTIEWIIGVLAARFAEASQPTPRQKWDNDLKPYLRTHGLAEHLTAEIQSVSRYFVPRRLAAHAAVMIAQVGESTQIFRLSGEPEKPKLEIVTINELEDECATARAGYEAIKEIGRALDDHDAAVLGGLNSVLRAMLLDRV